MAAHRCTGEPFCAASGGDQSSADVVCCVGIFGDTTDWQVPMGGDPRREAEAGLTGLACWLAWQLAEGLLLVWS